MGLLDSCAALKYLFKLVGFVGSQGLTYGHFIYSFIRFWNFFLKKKKKKGSSISCGSGRVRGTILLVLGDYILTSMHPF